MSRTLLLDLDGTLVDTVPDLTSALNRLMRSRGLPVFAPEQVAAMVGDGVAVLVTRAFAAHDRQPDINAVTEMAADYTAHVAVESRLYPNVLPVLTSLTHQGWRLAVCTNKPEQAARAASIPSIFAAWGYGPAEMAAGSAAIAGDIGEAAALANRLLPGAG